MARLGVHAKGEARRDQILQTAMSALAQGGYRNISLRAIGRTLGIQPAHILYYFDSREELLQEVVRQWDADTGPSGLDDLLPEATLDLYVDKIRSNLKIPGIVHLYLTFAAEAVHPDHAAHDFFRDRFSRARDLLEDAIKYEQGVGRIPGHVHADVEARKLIAIADGLQLQRLIDPAIDAPGELAAAIAALRGEDDPRASAPPA